MSERKSVNSTARARAGLFLTVVVAVGAGAAGCRLPAARPTIAQGLQSDDVDERIGAIIRAGEKRDASVVPLLVDRLDDRDEAARMFAIGALEKTTGTRRGYVYYESPERRAAAVGRWRQWLRERAPGEGGP